ncbi:MAG: N-acetyltransferase [Dehalococcoidia bacterium]|nr:N-acetyltransferase [Dehalococcoidia bacterium]
MEYAVIRKDVVLGDNIVIHPHVVIESNVTIGDNVEIFPGAYIGKIPGGPSLLRKPVFKKMVKIGNNCHVGPNAVIYYDVEIGDNTLIGDGASVREQSRIGAGCLISRCVTINYAAVIGEGTDIMDNTHITGKSQIGKHVFVAPSVTSGNDNSVGKSGYNEDRIQGPIIEDNASIGIGAVLLPGIVIGRNALVAAGSVVTKNVPENAVVVGIPARVVRYIQDDQIPGPKKA